MNNYEIINTIGEGAYGVVLKARKLDTNTLVAIKKFKQTDDDDLIRKTTVRELKVLRALQHKNIVELKEAFKKKGIVYLVFQYLDNNLLEVLERTDAGLSLKAIGKFMYQLLEGLEYMHENNYIHRDIKPQNLLINKNQGVLKICDMGFARVFDHQMTDYVATRWYRPPQLLIGSAYGSPIDIWAVGCIMAELADSQPLFPGTDEIDQLYQIISGIGDLPHSLHEKLNKNPVWKDLKFPASRNQPHKILQKYRNKISDKGVNLLSRMLQLDPEKRISASEALKHPFFDIIRPKKARFQKTSENFSGKERIILGENYTDRKLRDSETNRAQAQAFLSKPHQKLLKYPIKSIIQNENTVKPSKNPLYKIKQNPNRKTHTQHPMHSNSTVQNNSTLVDITKIYKKQEHPQNKYLLIPRKQERHYTNPISQKFNLTANSTMNLMMINGHSEKNHTKTRTEFRVVPKKQQKINNFYI